MRNFITVYIPPHKPNIKYSVLVTKKSPSDLFAWLVKAIKEKMSGIDKMLIFFRQIKHLNDAFEIVDEALGNSNVLHPTAEVPVRICESYHMSTDESVKEAILKEFPDSLGDVRVVMCSTSFSMGMNVHGINTIIHYGPANDLDDYVQMTGRAGRNDQQAHAILIKFPHCLSGRNISPEMKEYINTPGCRRVKLMAPYMEQIQPLKPGHDCCDVCEQSCDCELVCPLNRSPVVDLLSSTDMGSSEEDSDSADDSDSDQDEIWLRKGPQILHYNSDSGKSGYKFLLKCCIYFYITAY